MSGITEGVGNVTAQSQGTPSGAPKASTTAAPLGFIGAGLEAAGDVIGGEAAQGIFGASGSDRGKDQRDYMNAAYPDLNQQEQAGAGQSGDATAAEANKSAEKMNRAQNRTALKANDATNISQQGINAATNAASERVAANQLAEQARVNDATINEKEANTLKTIAATAGIGAALAESIRRARNSAIPSKVPKHLDPNSRNKPTKVDNWGQSPDASEADTNKSKKRTGRGRGGQPAKGTPKSPRAHMPKAPSGAAGGWDTFNYKNTGAKLRRFK